MENLINAYPETPLDIYNFIIIFLFATIFSFILRFHYIKFGSTISNRKILGNIIPIICLTTTLVILIIKSSLALSLGLVGALSIVRFRTPIKDMEELTYIFLSITLGIGYGANQLIVTSIALIIILIIIFIINNNKENNSNTNPFLLTIKKDNYNQSKNEILNNIKSILIQIDPNIKLKKIDFDSNSLEIIFNIIIKDTNYTERIIKELEKEYPDINVSFLDLEEIPNI